MKTANILVIILLFVLTQFKLAFSQGEVADSIKITFKNEKSGGFFLNSNGWGFNYMYGRRTNELNKTLWEIDFNLVKHPREFKQESMYQPSSRFAYGKLATCLNFRYGIGQQREIYSKFDKGGIAIRYFYSVGASVVLLKPIYYEVVIDKNFNTKSMKFEDIDSPSFQLIINSNGFLKGLGETKFIPGAFAKAGMSFEYSNREEILNALEAGGFIDIFVKAPEIMAEIKNDIYMIGLFVNYRFGKVINKR